MITLADFRDYLKEILSGLNDDVRPANYYVGRLDGKKNKSVGIYQLSADNNIIPLGGEKNRGYNVKKISILIHWETNYNASEIASGKIYDEIRNIAQRGDFIGDDVLQFLTMDLSEPVDVGLDAAGVYERVIELTVYTMSKSDLQDGIYLSDNGILLSDNNILIVLA